MAKSRKLEVEIPNLDNATPSSLADELGAVRESLSALKKLEGIYKQALMARLDEGQHTVDGEKFSVLIEDITQMRLDTDRIKSDADPKWLAERYKEISFTTIRTTRR